MRIASRRRVRLRSASSQLPQQSSRIKPFAGMGNVTWYVLLLLMLAVVLCLNNFVIFYIHSGTEMQTEKLPSTHERYIGIGNLPSQGLVVQRELYIQPEVQDLRKLMQTNADERSNDANAQLPENAQRSNQAVDQPNFSTLEPLDISVNNPRAGSGPRLEQQLTPNEILQRSAIILVSSEKSCHLQEIFDVLRDQFTDMPIYLPQNSATVKVCLTSSHVHCVENPPHCTEACQKNRMVKAASNKKAAYVFVWDTQYTNPQADTLALLAKMLVDIEADIIAACDKDICNSTTGLIHRSSSGELTALPGLYNYRPRAAYEGACYPSHLFHPIFLARVNVLTAHPWDELLPSGDHTEFLIQAQAAKLASFVCKNIKIVFNGTCSKLSERFAFTNPATEWMNMPSLGFKKWNITRVYSGMGTEHVLTPEGISTREYLWLPLPSAITSENVDESNLVNTVLQYHNDQLPGWRNVRLKSGENRSTLYYMKVSPCMYRIMGKLLVEYDRHSSFPNSGSVIDVDITHINRSCPIFKHYFKLTKYGKLQRRHVYYVTSVSNDTEYMKRLLLQVNNQTDRAFTNLVIVDMGRPGSEQFNISSYLLNIAAHYLYLGPPFSRSVGLKRGYLFAQKFAQEKGHLDPILFALDTSMLIPTDFTRRVWRSTRCGVSSYAPICYKSRTDGGFWVQYGYGMLGTCASDYKKAGGWDSKWGYHWGAEDVDLTHRLQDILPYTVRIKESNYKHLYTGANRLNAKEYYSKKNVYPGALPVTPITRPLKDTELAASLAQFAISKMKYDEEITLHDAYQTATANHKVLYDLRFTNNINEEYFALIESL